MKYLIVLFSIFFCFCSTKQDNLNNESISLDFKITQLKSNLIQKKLFFDPMQKSSIDAQRSKIIQLTVNNKSSNVIIFTDFGYHFPLNEWYQDGKLMSLICGGTFKRFGCRISVKEKDSTNIYVSYPLEADSFPLRLEWEKDSIMRFEELRFCKNKKGEIELRSVKNIRKADYELDYYHKKYSDCGFLPKIEDVVEW